MTLASGFVFDLLRCYGLAIAVTQYPAPYNQRALVLLMHAASTGKRVRSASN